MKENEHRVIWLDEADENQKEDYFIIIRTE